MSIHTHPNAAFEHLGRVYDFDLKGVRTSGRSEAEVADAILGVPGDFDCFIVNRRGVAISDLQLVLSAIARRTRGWVEVFGIDAEAIHDAVDRASVELGRQKEVGEGDPMTTWDSEMDEVELAKYVSMGGQGECALKVLVYFAAGPEEGLFFMRVKDCVASRRSR